MQGVERLAVINAELNVIHNELSVLGELKEARRKADRLRLRYANAIA